MRHTMGRITWVCEVCQKPVADDKGYLLVDNALAVDRYRVLAEQAAERGEGPTTLEVIASDMADAPPQARWHVYHRACDPSAEGDEYWIAVERIRTLPQLLHWNSHLSEKNWIGSTDWYRFIEKRLT